MIRKNHPWLRLTLIADAEIEFKLFPLCRFQMRETFFKFGIGIIRIVLVNDITNIMIDRG